MKTDTSTDTTRGSWPSGKYCIYKKGGSCPINLTSGYIKWDDEDHNNSNNKTGTLPDGVYDHNTKIEFCCRTDGDKNNPISLPTLKPFFLLAFDSAECQQVKWAIVSVEWIRFDNEDTGNADDQGGSHPHGAGIDNHKIHYCYYQGCNETLTELNGTFHSPNYPNRYPDGQYCSWRITVSPAQQIHLTFTAFNLQNENNTDALYVYDGENSTGEVLGVFYGSHTPPFGGINSSSNQMFLIFKSDKNISYTGFSALYKAVDCLGNHCNPSSQTSKLTPSLTMPYSFGTRMFSSDTKLTRNSSIRRLITTSQKIDSPMTSNKISTSKGVLMVASLPVTKMSTGFSAPGKSVMTTTKARPFVVSSTRKPIVTSISTELVPTSCKIQLASSSSVTRPVLTSGSIYWPAGSYGIPKAASGCPGANGFQWLIGRRYQDTEDSNPNNHKSSQFHLDATVDSKRGIIRSFCMKTDTSTDITRGSWPPGKYCIYKKGGYCPINLTSGYIRWDDEDNNNKNNKTGTLPDGVYDRNTKIEFCCRTDGNKNNPISLPTLKPFFLLAYDSAECQHVKWAVVSVEWIRFDNEDSSNADDQGGSHPHGAGIDNHKIHYCYYQGCNETLTALKGTFHSPNYPNKYPDGQYCSWRITVSSAQQIHLTFIAFNLQNENNTDALYVYDGENSTGEVLGVFYGNHTPPIEGINSSSNQMFLIFKSDKSISYTGFSALYKAVDCLGNHCNPSSQTSKLTPSLIMPYSFGTTIKPWSSQTLGFPQEPLDFQKARSIHWPAGSYGIPKAASGCPGANGFQWLIGRRYQDTEDSNPNN
ncbi:unnamed protein product [Porites evermanni]|uniref:CUB domain-containing protein n=2 Tax=Porites evermanni TaxID=104178 RepID=A0ABN8QM25_9CNID|nr:unnamed protein product [Porites evermanni]